MQNKTTRIFLLIILCFTNGNYANAQEQEKLTVEWIYSSEGRHINDLPKYLWLDNGAALLYDTRKPKDERIFEIFDPKTGVRTPAIQRDSALVSLNQFQGSKKLTRALTWPLSFDRKGRQAVYLFGDDIFLLNLEQSQFRQITHTKEKEIVPRFSPDGELLAFVRENDLYVYHITMGTETRITTDGSETIRNGTLSWVYWEEIFGRHDLAYWWSDDSKAIAYLQTDESPVSVMHFVDFKPASPRLITQRYPKAGENNPVVRVAIAEINGATITPVNLDTLSYEYIARVKWLPGSNRLSVQTLNRAQTELTLYFVERRTGKPTHILTETDSAWVNIHDDLYFLNDDKHFIWSSERDGYAHLYRFTMDGKLVNQITRGNWAIRSANEDVSWLRQAVVAVDEKNDQVYFTAMEKSSVERHLYRIKLDGTGHQRLSQKEGWHQVCFSPNYLYYFNEHSHITSLSSLSLYKKDGKLIHILAEPRPGLLDKFAMQYPELFTIPTPDGFPMPASLLKPKDFDPAHRYPLILNVYGGPSAPIVQNTWQSSIFYDNILLQHGYLVARVDNRSATAISKTLENLTLYQISGPIELGDLLDAVRWFKSQPYIDPDRVGIWGWSGGGSFTLNAMTHSTDFKAGIAIAPVTDWHYYDTRWAEFAMKRPEDNPGGYEKTSLVKSATNLHGRLLLVHGNYDDNVHPQNTWSFADELINAGIIFEMMIYPMRQHDIADVPARVHLYNTMLEFWDDHLVK